MSNEQKRKLILSLIGAVGRAAKMQARYERNETHTLAELEAAKIKGYTARIDELVDELVAGTETLGYD